MKSITLLLIACLPAIVFAQKNKYTIRGTIGNYNSPAKIYLLYWEHDNKVTDSAILKDGKFQIEGAIDAPVLKAYLILNKKGNGLNLRYYKSVYLEKGIITVTSPDSITNASIRGTKNNDDINRFTLALKPIDDAYEALEARKNAATTEQKKSEAFEKEINKAQQNIDEQKQAFYKKFILDNPDSYVSLISLGVYANNAGYSDLEPLFNGLSPAIKETDEGKNFAERLAELKAVLVGSTAPEFAEPDTSGKMISLSSFRGKYVLIDFWASWCAPCRAENPNLIKAYKRYKNKNFTILGVSLDRAGDKDKWLKAIRTDGLPWIQVSDLKSYESQAVGLYAIQGIPQNFLIGPNGRIIAENLHGDDVENKLAEVLGKL